MTHSLEIRNLTKVFSEDTIPVKAVNDVSFTIRDDEFFTMLGPSGCGKTTTLRMISGLESITSGSIEFDGRDFLKMSAAQRNIGMVFQSYALFPHMTIRDNTAYGLRVRKLPEAEINKRVTTILQMLGLSDLAARNPPELSGGQQQRVAIARALVYRPEMLLLDEPLANLDAKLRVQMREEIRRLQKEQGIMAIYVTHDQEEAMSVSDRIAVFDNGRLMQVGAPQDIYNNPESLFVSDFIGQANFFPARILAQDNYGARIRLGSGHEETLATLVKLGKAEVNKIENDFDASVMIRPSQLTLNTGSGSGIIATVKRILFLGSYTRYMVDCPDSTREVFVDSPFYLPGIGEGDRVSLTLQPEHTIVFYRAAASENTAGNGVAE